MTQKSLYELRKDIFHLLLSNFAPWVKELSSAELQELLPFIASYEIVPRQDEDLVICIAEDLRFPTIDIPETGAERERQLDELHKVIALKLAHDVQVDIMRRRGELGGQSND